LISYLLDTHILVWWLLDVHRLSKLQTGVLNELLQTNQPAGLSALSLRETAFMIQRERLEVDASLDAWLDSIDSHPLLTILPADRKDRGRKRPAG
jgi:PIN domain nuclease of toxin-antitoxin system